MPITFLSFIEANKEYLKRLLLENDKVIDDRMVNQFYRTVMGQWYCHPSEHQAKIIRAYAKQLIKEM